MAFLRGVPVAQGAEIRLNTAPRRLGSCSMSNLAGQFGQKRSLTSSWTLQLPLIAADSLQSGT